MDPGSVPPELIISNISQLHTHTHARTPTHAHPHTQHTHTHTHTYTCIVHTYCISSNHIALFFLFKRIVRSRTNADFSTNVHLSLTQWTIRYSGHVINLSQDIPSFVSSFPRLPSDLDIVIARKEGSNNHHDFCVRRSKILTPLQWLVANNIYFNDITISYDNLSALPENDHVTNIPTISVSSDDTYFDDQHDLSTSTTEDHYNSVASL